MYFQVVTLGLYTYFIAALMGKQMIPTRKEYDSPDMYVPLFAMMQVSTIFPFLFQNVANFCDKHTCENNINTSGLLFELYLFADLSIVTHAVLMLFSNICANIKLYTLDWKFRIERSQYEQNTCVDSKFWKIFTFFPFTVGLYPD